MIRTTTTILAFALASPAVAADIVLTVRNQSSQAVSGLSAYPARADGSIVEDNIGGFIEAVAPGAEGYADLALNRCGPVFVRITMADASELTTIIDTCTEVTLAVTD